MDQEVLANIYVAAGRYESLRDANDVRGMTELDLVMSAEPLWPRAKAFVLKNIEEWRSHVNAVQAYAD